MKIEDIEEKVESLAGPVALSMGLEVVAVEYAAGQGGRVLRVYIDKPSGVTVDDCSAFSREFSTILDVEDMIPDRYTLEVSSPGLDRILKKEKDFVMFAGKTAKIRTKEPIEGRKNFKGELLGVQGDGVALKDEEGRSWVIPMAVIDKARLVAEI